MFNWILTSAQLIAVLLAVVWVSEKLGIDWTKFQSPAPTPAPYQWSESDCEAYASMVLAALKRAQNLEIQVPSAPDGIYTARVQDMGGVHDGKATFRFEVKREPPHISGGKQAPDMPAQEVARALAANLPAYLWGGYSVPENITAYDIGNRRIRIECVGITRIY